ncbi:MarC family protein [uncultured Litoreibacter sp.]|uniref:MarC family protein n=1 Tax=uncultured Litoreibacter sp. TaxID=1392394 RepID=UPI002603D651|nr:MarC family protein [uncultured Litoreibacter sp.]
MEMALAVTAFFTLFVVIDPIGLAPMFVAMTSGMTQKQRLRIAATSCLVAVFILTVFGLAGQKLLDFVGISLAAFRISGGILLFITALDMLFERRTARREEKADDASGDLANDPSVFPLAMPLIAGPGALASMILLSSGADWDVTVMILGVMLAVVALVFVMFLLATPIEKLLGATGVVVATRLMGMLLAALSVQFVVDGMRDLGVLAAG